ncbi:MAG: NAD-dependent epimerase/dehydratase family protein [Halodesulfurarchaeum sp.]
MEVAILGCGYVGLELGRRLSGSHSVYGIRRSSEGLSAIDDAGFKAVQADLTDSDSLSGIPDVDVLVFAASAGRGTDAARSVYVDGMRTVVDHFGARDSVPDRLVYTSSTGVYGDFDGEWVDESTPIEPTTERQQLLLDAEALALDRTASVGMSGTVVRFGGLYGPGRYRLDRYLESPVTEGVLNLTHRADAAGAIEFLLETGRGGGEIVIAVDEEPVEKTELVRWLAREHGTDPPTVQTPRETIAERDLDEAAAHRLRANKRCSSAKLRTMGYEFQYPTYRDGFKPAIESSPS